MTNKQPWLVEEANKDNFIEVMGAKVFLKPLKYGDSRQALSMALEINEKGQAKVDTGLLATMRALYQIEDWELTDKEGNKLPVDLDTLDNKLSEPFVDELMTKIEESKNPTEVSEEEKKV